MLVAAPGTKLTKTAVATRLGVSRASLYYKRTLPAKDLTLKGAIEGVWARSASHASYGHRRLAIDLGVNKKRMLRVMRLFGLQPPRRRVAKPEKLDDQGKASAPYPNLVKHFCPRRPNVVWVTDFTYLWAHGHWLYLATILDMFTREVLGWAVSRAHDTTLVLEALQLAHQNQGQWPRYHHSDQGSEYDAAAYLDVLEANDIQISMSKKASPWENGYQESYYSQFKVDLGQLDQFDSLGELVEAIAQTIYVYNTSRIHLSLKMSPRQFRRIKELASSTIPFGDKSRVLV